MLVINRFVMGKGFILDGIIAATTIIIGIAGLNIINVILQDT
jgi:hypothetical protein